MMTFHNSIVIMFCIPFVESSSFAFWVRRAGTAAFAVSSSRSRCARAALFSSSSSEPAGFDAESSRLYKIIAENHRHPSGPWTTMLGKINLAKKNDDDVSFRVLDLATGPGEPAESIARKYPYCTVIATDISPDQVAITNEKAALIPNMSAQVADMENLVDTATTPLEEESFDIVTCCYGFMFPPDIPKAVAESYRVLKPGGTLIATTWNKVALMEQLRAVMTEVLGSPPPPPPMNPLSLKDPGLFESMLNDAGFTDIQTETHEYPFDMTNDPEIEFKGRSSWGVWLGNSLLVRFIESYH